MRNAVKLLPDAALPEGPAGHLTLAWDVIRRGRSEDLGAARGPFFRLTKDIATSARMTFGKRLMGLVESVRTSDFGVTITSFEKAAVCREAVWREWSTRIPGAAPSIGLGSELDRVGVFIRLDGDKHRGTMTFVVRAVDLGTGELRHLKILPVACTFDWSDDFSPPSTVLGYPTADDIRAWERTDSDPTPAMLEGSPDVWAKMVRRVGVVENPYSPGALEDLKSTGSKAFEGVIETAIH
jgi:hypothetical protein